MKKFFNYADYAEWRNSGDNCDRPVKLVGEGCWDWVEKYEDKATIARLTAELAESRDDASALLAQLAAAEKYMEKVEAELTAANQRAAASVEAVVRANGERDALVAAAYEAAAKWMDDQSLTEEELSQGYGFTVDYPRVAAEKLRALATAHATAALDRIKAEARADGYAQGVRDAANAKGLWLQLNSSGEPTGGYCTVQAHDPGGMVWFVKQSTILALIPASPPAEPVQVTVREADRETVVETITEIIGETHDIYVQDHHYAAFRAIAGGNDNG